MWQQIFFGLSLTIGVLAILYLLAFLLWALYERGKG